MTLDDNEVAVFMNARGYYGQNGDSSPELLSLAQKMNMDVQGVVKESYFTEFNEALAEVGAYLVTGASIEDLLRAEAFDNPQLLTPSFRPFLERYAEVLQDLQAPGQLASAADQLALDHVARRLSKMNPSALDPESFKIFLDECGLRELIELMSPADIQRYKTLQVSTSEEDLEKIVRAEVMIDFTMLQEERDKAMRILMHARVPS